jgi:spermidine synthase
MKIEHWFSEMQNEDVKLSVRIKSHVFSKESKYQRIDIFDTEFYGRIMVLDGCFMVTYKDEFMYQEMLAHPAMMSHENPKNILIIGGGDGGIAREVLRYNVEKVDLVEIDEDVINASKEYLPQTSVSFKDKRLNVYNQDAFDFVDGKRKYDVILVDSTDPVGFAASLFSDVFYMKAKESLKDGGIIATQSGSPFMNPDHIKKAVKGMKKYFQFIKPYVSFMPTYPSGMWSYVMASNKKMEMKREFTGKYMNREIYEGSQKLPQFMKEIID